MTTQFEKDWKQANRKFLDEHAEDILLITNEAHIKEMMFNLITYDREHAQPYNESVAFVVQEVYHRTLADLDTIS